MSSFLNPTKIRTIGCRPPRIWAMMDGSGRIHGRRTVGRDRCSRRAGEDATRSAHDRPDQDRPHPSRRRVRRHLRRLQPRRRSARRGPARRRLRGLPLARLEVPLGDRPGRARLRGGRRSGLRHAGRGRPRLRRLEPAHAAHAQAARAASAGAPARAPRRPAPRGRDLDHRDGRRQSRATRPRTRCSSTALDARRRALGLRDAPAAAQRAQVPALRGLLLEERAGLHLALLDHADGSRRPARPGLRGDRPLGRRDPGRDADPLGLRLEPLLQDGRAHELHPEPDHDRATAC